MPWDHNTELIGHILEEAGFDVVIKDMITGIKEEGDNSHQVFLNPKGRIRYQYSEMLNHNSQGHQLFGREFSIDRENRDIVNVYGELKSSDELVRYLQTIPQLVRKGDKR